MRLYAMKTFYDNRLGLVTLEDDVLSIVRQVREEYDTRISIQLDPVSGFYHFVEHGDDGTDRLVFTAEQLSPLELDRLRKADSQRRGYEDPYDAAEREQDDAQHAVDELGRAQMAEEGERLAHALKRDGVEDLYPTRVAVTREISA